MYKFERENSCMKTRKFLPVLTVVFKPIDDKPWKRNSEIKVTPSFDENLITRKRLLSKGGRMGT